MSRSALFEGSDNLPPHLFPACHSIVMKTTRLPRLFGLLIIFLLGLSGQNLRAAAGDLDPLDVSISGGKVLTTVLQPDGKIIIAGVFSSVQGVPRKMIARINPDGTLDNGFDPHPNSSVVSIVVQADGKIILGGFFTALQPGSTGPLVERQRLARLNADGTLDTSFDPKADQGVLSVTGQADGKIVVAGYFNSIQPAGAVSASTRHRIARLNADGTLDSGFAPDLPGNDVDSVAIQRDGKILITGDITPPGGTFRSIARLNADGSPDTTFNPSTSGSPSGRIRSIAIQANDKILLGGDFLFVSGYARNHIARLNSDGTVDTGFNPNANNTVSSMAVQADGKILIVGSFTSLSSFSASRYFVARLYPDGRVDRYVDPRASGAVYCVALQADGGILLGGSFNSFQPNGTLAKIPRSCFARLHNDPATGALAIPTGNQVSWTLGGSSPDFSRVSFQLSSDAGMTWTSLGAGERVGVSTTWRINDLPLPSSGRIRALGVTSDAVGSTGGLIESVADFGELTDLPEIAVFAATGTASADGRLSDSPPYLFASTPVGDSGTQVFTVKNTGLSELTGLAISITGTDPAAFIVSNPSAILSPGATTTFSVKFSPTAIGVRSAVVNLSSNDPDDPNFIINIQGTAIGSKNADLSDLSLSAGSLTPAFDPAVTTFSTEVPNAISSLRVTPTKAETNASISVGFQYGNSSVVASGSASDPLPLNAGVNHVEVVVTAQNGKTRKTYNLTVTRAGAVQGSVDPLIADADSIAGVATQPDGKMILVGGFDNIGGVARNHIARLNADGTLDPGFDPGTEGYIGCVTLQADGKILIGGFFSTITPTGTSTSATRNNIARLNADGSLDGSFDPNPNMNVNCIVIQPDGKLLLGGGFTMLQPNGAAAATARNYIARLNADGTLDPDFNPNVDNFVTCLALQPDGKVLLGGAFNTIRPDGAVPATSRKYVARINADGTTDADFSPNPDEPVYCLAVQPDGKVLLGGWFSTLQPNDAAAATTRRNIARVNSDGTLDTGFHPNANNVVSSLAIEVNGKVLMGGAFTWVQPDGAESATTRNNIARVYPDGTLDADFDPNTDGQVGSVSLQADGKVLLGGWFRALHPNAATQASVRSGFARLFNDPATQDLVISDTTRIGWMRGGSSPEVEQVTFEISTNGGTDYTLLGAGNRIDGGWELSGLSLSHGLIRARGRSNGSGGFVETITNFDIAATPIAIWRQNYFGSSANTGTGADGSDPDHDGLVNLIEYAFGLNPTVPDTALLPQLQRTGGNLSFIFTPPSGIGGITYGAEWSNDFSSWNSITDTGSAPQRVFTVTAAGKTALFVRLTVTAP